MNGELFVMNPRDLPIFELERSLVAAASGGGHRIILQAPTGSGKSTQIPQMLCDHGLVPAGRKVVVLQPRRLAARLLATRVAAERDGVLGDEVGYQIRFEDQSSAATRIQYVTEGILLRRLLGDPTLADIAVMIFDEFHERHLYGDVTLARAVQIQAGVRPDLTLMVMSATLDTGMLEKYLQPCTVLRSQGRMFPVELEYLEQRVVPGKVPVWELAATETAHLLRRHTEGDVLVFMPGMYEIQRTLQSLAVLPETRGCCLLPLHGDLSVRDQDTAVASGDRRKIVVTTNVAETSITIPGIRLVVDSGLARIARFDPHRGINTLLVEKISRSSAEQRAGRAGRTASGVCRRLWTQAEQGERAPRDVPEIRRMDLAEAVLTLKAGGIDDVRGFRWVDPPDPKSLDRAEQLLQDLGAVEISGRITPLGRQMLAFPVHPRYARMLVAAAVLGCVRSVALIAALTQERSLLERHAGRDAATDRELRLGEERLSDFFVLMRAWQDAEAHAYDVARCRRMGIHAQTARQVGRLYAHFVDIAKRERLPLEPEPVLNDAVRRCLLAGFADQVARRCDSGTLRCELVHGRSGQLARESVVRQSPLLVAGEVREVEGRNRDDRSVLIGLATAIEPAWLETLFPEGIHEEQRAFFDCASRRVLLERRRLFRDLPLATKAGGNPSETDAAALLAEEVCSRRHPLRAWDQDVEQWILRVNSLRRWCPELGLPEITAEEQRRMVQEVCRGAYSIRELQERPVLAVVRSWLTAEQQRHLDRLAPEKLDLPGGKPARVLYAADGPPSIAMRIQDLYGLTGTLGIAKNRECVVIRILAPNFRPVQITRDLSGFWRDEYPKVKNQMQRKYPKHEWR